MDTVANLKEQAITQTPLLLFDVVLAGGPEHHWCTHGVTANGESYSARVLRHNLFEIQTASDYGIDAIPKIALTLANADSLFSQVEAATGFKGGKLKATFLFYDLVQDEPASESIVVFEGILNPPEEITETTFRLSAVNRMNMQRLLLPSVRIQRRCPWTFPSTTEERQQAVSGGNEGAHSRFFRCGYSPDRPGGVGSLNGGQFNFQVEGLLGAVNDAVPVVSVQQALSIRDVYAFVKEAPTGAALQLRINQDGNEVTTFSIAAGQTVSTPVSGASLPALQALANLTLDIVTVGTSYPGRDLTVTIRV